MVAFGHATFFGGAAYVTAHALKEWGFGAGSGLLIGVAFALVAGFLMGIIAIRRQGFYFAMTTLALSQMAYFALFQAPSTNAEDGIQRVPRPDFLGLVSLADNMTLYRSEEHTSELQSRQYLVCRLLLEKKKRT